MGLLNISLLLSDSRPEFGLALLFHKRNKLMNLTVEGRINEGTKSASLVVDTSIIKVFIARKHDCYTCRSGKGLKLSRNDAYLTSAYFSRECAFAFFDAL